MSTNNELLQDQWRNVLSLLPDDLEEMAKETGALYRKRNVKSASDLLRLVFACTLCAKSLREASAWAGISGFAKLSNVAVLKRLRHSADLLAKLVTYKLRHKVAFPERRGACKICG